MLRHFVLATMFLMSYGVELPAAGACKTTLTPSPSFVPPAPYPERPRPENFWYGSAKLWTQLPITGIWQGTRSDGSYVTKLVFWRQGFDWRTEPNPNLILTARRLDGEAPSVALSHANPVFVNTKSPAIMVGLGIPTPGCWDITAYYNGVSLEFVVSILP